jgi:hypothetical protein
LGFAWAKKRHSNTPPKTPELGKRRNSQLICNLQSSIRILQLHAPSTHSKAFFIKLDSWLFSTAAVCNRNCCFNEHSIYRMRHVPLLPGLTIQRRSQGFVLGDGNKDGARRPTLQIMCDSGKIGNGSRTLWYDEQVALTAAAVYWYEVHVASQRLRIYLGAPSLPCTPCTYAVG